MKDANAMTNNRYDSVIAGISPEMGTQECAVAMVSTIPTPQRSGKSQLPIH